MHLVSLLSDCVIETPLDMQWSQEWEWEGRYVMFVTSKVKYFFLQYFCSMQLPFYTYTST